MGGSISLPETGFGCYAFLKSAPEPVKISQTDADTIWNRSVLRGLEVCMCTFRTAVHRLIFPLLACVRWLPVPSACRADAAQKGSLRRMDMEDMLLALAQGMADQVIERNKAKIDNAAADAGLKGAKKDVRTHWRESALK